MDLRKTAFMLYYFLIANVCGEVTDEEYSLMPPVFHLDDFDRCMLLGEKALYCSVTVQLTPADYNDTKVWKIIREVSSKVKNYRHDRLRHGVCVPHSCPEIKLPLHNEELLATAISQCYSDKYFNLSLKGTVTKLHCETNTPFYPTDIYDVLVTVCLLLLAIVVIFASYYEGRARYKSKEEYDRITRTKFGSIVSCFSIPKNWKRLASKSTDPDATSLQFVNGVRFYNILLVIITHTCMVPLATAVSNPQFPESITSDALIMILVNGAYAIQTFFLLAGWLLSYHFFLTFEGRKEVKLKYIVLALVNRYVRLTPTLVVMVAISGTWLYHSNTGPLWDKAVGQEYRNCRQNWWANLLYINNYYDIEHICMQHTWYLAADTQLFVVSLLVVVLMWRYNRYTNAILAAYLGTGIIIPFVINYVRDYDILVREYPENLYEILLEVPEWKEMYASGYTNMNGYALGLIFGYLFYKCRGKKVLTKKFHVVIWWILTWTLPLSMIFLGIPFYKENFQYSRFGAATYVALAKPIFELGIGIALFGMSRGIGWFLRDAVLWSPIQVLGRLTYCVYLVHVGLIRARTGQTRSPYYMTPYNLITNACGDIVIAYLVALILCLFVEMPTSALQKLMVPQLASKRRVGLIAKPTEVEPDVKTIDGDQTSNI